MALTDKDILITPNTGSSSADPKIEYVGADSSGNDTITVETLFDGTKATLSYEGSAGQLFSVVNDLTTDPIFSVNDVSGIPSIEVDSDGDIRLAEFSGNVGIGTSSPTELLHVDGRIKANNLTLSSLSAQNSEATAVMIDGSGIIGTRELGSNAFNSTAFLTGNQTITLSGDVSGSGTTSISVTVNDDSHNHIISNVDGLQTALDAKEPLNDTILHRGSDISTADWNTFIDGTEASWNTVLNHSGSNRPSGSYTYGTALSFSKSAQAGVQLYIPETASNGGSTGGIWYRSKWNTNYRPWVTLWDSANDGSGSGLDADLLDGQHGSYYLDYNNFTNTPTIPSLSGYATETYVNTQVSNLVDSAPSTLDTLNELAAALGDDANFSTTTSTALGNRLRVDTASQGLTGTQQANAITNLGITATKAELNYVDGVTSNIQTQLDGKQPSGSYLTGNQTITLSGDVSGSGTTSIAVTIADDSHNHVISNVDGLQTALDGKVTTTTTQTISGAKTFTGGIASDTFTGYTQSGSYIDFDDDGSGNGINCVTINSLAGLNLIWDSNDNDSSSFKLFHATSEVFAVDPSGNLTLSGTVDGVDIAARDHDAVTLAGTPDYITISGQTITRNQIDLTSDVTGVLPSANLDADTAHLSGSQTFTGVKTFNSNVIIGGATYASYGSGSTDITGLINGSTFGSIQYASGSGHHVIGLRDNDVNDSFAVISGSGNYNTDTTYDKLVFRAQAGGQVTVGGNLDVASGVDVTGNITVSGTVDGRDIATDGTKLDTIDTNADVTPSWVPSSDPNYLTGNQTITLSGDVSGSGTTSISVTVADDSHNHVISNVDGLQSALDAKLASSSYTAADVLTKIKTVDGSGSGLDADLLDGYHKERYHRSALSTFSSGDWNNLITHGTVKIQHSNFSNDTNPPPASYAYGIAEILEGEVGGENRTLQIYYPHNNTDRAHYIRMFNNTSWTDWRTVPHTVSGAQTVWHSNNDGSGSGLDADLLDGQHASAFLTGNQTITLSGDVSGSGTTSISVTIADDSHNHVISNVDGLQTALDAKASLSGATFTGDIIMGANQVDFNAGGGNSTSPQIIGDRSTTDLDSRVFTTEGGLSYTTFDSTSLNKPSHVSNNANGVLTINTHSGSYNHQLAFTNKGNIAHRSRDGGGLSVWKNLLTDLNPNAPSITSTTTVNETIEIVFAASTSADQYAATAYEVWSDGGTGSDYSLIAKIPETDIASSMSVIDSSFDTDGTIAYRVYAIRHGVYSTAATTTHSFTMPSLDVSNMSVVPDINNYHIQYDLPDTRFLDHIEIYMDAEAVSGNLTRTGATLIYSGDNPSYTYNISSSDLDKYHQFWVEVVTV